MSDPRPSGDTPTTEPPAPSSAKGEPNGDQPEQKAERWEKLWLVLLAFLGMITAGFAGQIGVWGFDRIVQMGTGDKQSNTGTEETPVGVVTDPCYATGEETLTRRDAISLPHVVTEEPIKRGKPVNYTFLLEEGEQVFVHLTDTSENKPADLDAVLCILDGHNLLTLWPDAFGKTQRGAAKARQRGHHRLMIRAAEEQGSFSLKIATPDRETARVLTPGQEVRLPLPNGFEPHIFKFEAELSGTISLFIHDLAEAPRMNPVATVFGPEGKLLAGKGRDHTIGMNIQVKAGDSYVVYVNNATDRIGDHSSEPVSGEYLLMMSRIDPNGSGQSVLDAPP